MNRISRARNAWGRFLITWLAVITCFDLRSDEGALDSNKSALVADAISIEAHEPGVAVGVFRDGALVHASAYGMADLSHSVPFSIDTRSNLGSTSKQFTAFAILRLAADGRLSLGDEVRRWIPELPEFSSIVTIRHLLSHTSGYREIYQTLKLSGRRVFEDHVDRHEMIDVVRRQTELQNAPGSKWDYNNTGYGLLSMIVERVSEQSFAEYLGQYVFAPLGMTNSVVRMDPSDPVQNGARGYQIRGDRFVETRDLGGAVGASGIYSTIGDLLIWLTQYQSGTLERRLLIDEMTTPYRLSDGRSSGYGLGLYIDRWRGLKRVFHGGDDVAHRAITVYFPELEGGVIVLSNNAGFNQYRCANRLISKVAGDEYTLLPISRNRYRVQGQDARFEFEVDVAGKFKSAVLFHQGKQPLRRLLNDEPVEGRRDLSEFTGRYHSVELKTTYELELEKGTLVLMYRPLKEGLPLRAVQEDRFSGADPVSSVLFRRDEKGTITGFHVGNGSGREYVWFERARP